MVRLPFDILQNAGRSELPTGKMATDRADAADFGGDIARAVQGAGEIGMALASVVKRNEDQAADFRYQTEFLALVDQDSTAYAEASRNIQGDGAGHWERAREASRARFETWASRLPADVRQRFAPHIERALAARGAEAFRDQYRVQDAHTRNVLIERHQTGLTQIQQNPDAFETVMQGYEAAVNAAPIPPENKAEIIRNARAEAARTAEFARARNNPTSVIEGSYGGEAFRAAVRRIESGNDDRRTVATSSAVGRYQYLVDTWNSFADAAGVPKVEERFRRQGGPPQDGDPRLNVEWQERVFAVNVRQNAAILNRAGIPVTDANLYIMHFLGAGDGPKFLRGLQQNPDAVAAPAFERAAGSNPWVFRRSSDPRRNDGKGEPRTYREIFDFFAAKGLNTGGATPAAPRATDQFLRPEDRFRRDEIAERTIAEQERVAQQQATLAAAEQRRQFMVGIATGDSPDRSYDEAVASGLFATPEDVQRLVRAREQRRDRDLGEDIITGRNGRAVRQGGALIESAEAPRYLSSAERSAVNAAFDHRVSRLTGTPEERTRAAWDLARDIAQKTGHMPSRMAQVLTQTTRADGNTMQQRVQGFEAVRRMLREAPGSLDGQDGAERLRTDVALYERFVNENGLSPERAIERVDLLRRPPGDPERERVFGPMTRDVQAAMRALTPDVVERRVERMFNGWISSANFPNTAQRLDPQRDPELEPARRMAHRIFTARVEEKMRGGMVYAEAEEATAQEMRQEFGLQPGNVLTRFAPQALDTLKVNGSHNWIAEEALKFVQARREEIPGFTGAATGPQDIGPRSTNQIVLLPLVTNPSATRDAFVRARVDPNVQIPYSVVVINQAGGYDVLSTPFMLDAKAAAETRAAAAPTGRDAAGAEARRAEAQRARSAPAAATAPPTTDPFSPTNTNPADWGFPQ